MSASFLSRAVQVLQISWSGFPCEGELRITRDSFEGPAEYAVRQNAPLSPRCASRGVGGE
jgi:hypothetical protein